MNDGQNNIYDLAYETAIAVLSINVEDDKLNEYIDLFINAFTPL